MINFSDLPTQWLVMIYGYIWSTPLIIFIVGVGIYLTIKLKGIQFRYLGYALKLALGPQHDSGDKGDISHFQSLMTALAATIGIGNIAGVATAIVAGGMGALFWMWVTALIGMATRYAESTLAVKYRTTDAKGEMCGGPMYFIEYGLGWKWLSVSFAVFGALSAFGGGNMLQSNSVADVMRSMFGFEPLYVGIVVAILTGLTLIGGIKSIGRIASLLVPLMAFLYIGGAAVILVTLYERLPEVIWTIFSTAFTGQAAVGGFAGSTIILAIQMGVSRGLMTSEAGMGTASIAAAAAKTDVPGRQALVSMTGCFLATVVLCTVTGLVLGVTGSLGAVDSRGVTLTGAAMTVHAFQALYWWGGYIVTIGLLLFAFTTLIGWAYYGEKCCEYLFGDRAVNIYRVLFVLIIIPGAVLELDIVWKFSDIFNALMTLPNLVGLCALTGVVLDETRDFMKILKRERGRAIIKTKIMGVLNVTPDSFSGNDSECPLASVEHMIAEGADLIDIGGEATNPFVAPTSEADELLRVIPVIKKIRDKGIAIPISIDTMKAAVAEAALAAGATMINDVSGLRDPNMVAVAVNARVPVCFMHMQGTPQTMQLNPSYPRGVVAEILDWARRTADHLTAAGIMPENLIFDPGIGFGKTVADNYEIIQNLPEFRSLGFPLLLGASRKSFLGKILNKKPHDLDFASVAVHTAAMLEADVDYIRVHNVGAHRDAVEIARRIRRQ